MIGGSFVAVSLGGLVRLDPDSLPTVTMIFRRASEMREVFWSHEIRRISVSTVQV